jgi:hypothetical protein
MRAARLTRRTLERPRTLLWFGDLGPTATLLYQG